MPASTRSALRLRIETGDPESGLAQQGSLRLRGRSSAGKRDLRDVPRANERLRVEESAPSARGVTLRLEQPGPAPRRPVTTWRSRCLGSRISSVPPSWRAVTPRTPDGPTRWLNTSGHSKRATLALLEKVWPGQVVVYDPLVGEVQGHSELRHFVTRNRAWLADHRATTADGGRDPRRSTSRRRVGGHPRRVTGASVTWPIAVVADSADDHSVIFRTYCSTLPFDGQRHLRPPILEAGGRLPRRRRRPLRGGPRCWPRGRDRGDVPSRRLLARANRPRCPPPRGG